MVYIAWGVFRNRDQGRSSSPSEEPIVEAAAQQKPELASAEAVERLREILPAWSRIFGDVGELFHTRLAQAVAHRGVAIEAVYSLVRDYVIEPYMATLTNWRTTFNKNRRGRIEAVTYQRLIADFNCVVQGYDSSLFWINRIMDLVPEADNSVRSSSLYKSIHSESADNIRQLQILARRGDELGQLKAPLREWKLPLYEKQMHDASSSVPPSSVQNPKDFS